jgi:hypothetical protein
MSNLTEVGREYLGTASSFCRSCKEVEIFDRFRVTLMHTITEEVETRDVRICQGCGYESEGGR